MDWLGVTVVEEASVTVWSVSSPGEADAVEMSGGLRRRPGPVELLLFPSSWLLSLCTSVSGVSSTEIDFKLKLSSLQKVLCRMFTDRTHLERLVEEAAWEP